MEKLKLKYRLINSLKHAEYNPRKLSDHDYEHLKKSLERFEAVEPAVINMHPKRKNVIVGGNQRIRVAKDLGHKSFPCVEISLTKEKEKELNIRLNKNQGQFDYDLLDEFYDRQDLIEFGFKNDEFGIAPDDLGEGFELPGGAKEPIQQLTFTVSDEQAVFIKNKLDEIKQTDNFKYCETYGNENANGNALYCLARGE